MINEFKDLERLIRLCRKQGVTEVEVHGVKLRLGDLPIEPARAASAQEPDDTNPYDKSRFPQGELTPEQLMFYSCGGLPENDPELNKARDS